MSEVSDNAKLLHSKMRESPASKTFTQQEASNLVNVTKESELMLLLQELLNANMIKLSKTGDEIRFQAVSVDDAKKLGSMSDDERMIYSYIEASQREGIWTKTLKAKTNLHQHIVSKCLKNLEHQRYIKSIKSVKHPTRKIYMLYHLQPSIDVTGGPWFTDSELDTEFIDTILEVVWRFIVNKTFPRAEQEHHAVNPLQASYIASFQGVDLDQILEFINGSGVSSVELELNDIRSLCDVLKYDDKVEELDGHSGLFKATRQSLVEKGLMRNLEELKGQIPEETREYLVKNKEYSIFDFKTEVEDFQDEQDFVNLDSFVNV
ncbi:RPC34 [Candida metapsilosis]|uniref:DNA-directed RNA polymerase III subunit RPC6 n=1 Tax=Candida metapsilosis TaxID=273372 RepID=A0A8H8DCG0_9ASCO|nr:RPC34 [Candida metapsilosis]